MATGLDASLADLAERVSRSTVQVLAENRGGGCGVVWSGNRAIVTNAHVVGSARDVWIESHDGRRVRGAVALRDERLDLAEVSCDLATAGSMGATIGRAGALRVGDIVAALGAPHGIPGALSLGIVHRATTDRNGLSCRWLEADLRLAPGNSGGPMVDAAGRVVGVNSMIASGLALAIPSEVVDRFIRTRGAHAWLGVTTRPIVLRAEAAGGNAGAARPSVGFMIVEFAAESPAQRGGLALGDVIVGAGSTKFDNPSSFGLALEQVTPGDRIDLLILREQVLRTVGIVTAKLTAKVERAA